MPEVTTVASPAHAERLHTSQAAMPAACYYATCYYATALLQYATMLLCYCATMLPCYYATMLLVCYYATMLLCTLTDAAWSPWPCVLAGTSPECGMLLVRGMPTLTCSLKTPEICCQIASFRHLYSRSSGMATFLAVSTLCHHEKR